MAQGEKRPQFTFNYRDPQRPIPVLSALRREIAFLRVQYDQHVRVVSHEFHHASLLVEPVSKNVTLGSLQRTYGKRRGRWDIEDPTKNMHTLANADTLEQMT